MTNHITRNQWNSDAYSYTAACMFTALVYDLLELTQHHWQVLLGYHGNQKAHAHKPEMCCWLQNYSSSQL